ncbi:MAG: tyrosine-type recombinase/integrase [Nanoarchaeota archaeon]
MEIYHHKRESERLLLTIGNSRTISPNNKLRMLEFRDDCLANNIGLARIVKCLHILKNVAVWLNKDFDICKTEDIKRLVAQIEVMENYSPRTKVDYRGIIKKFFNWLPNKVKDLDVSWIKTSFKKHNDKLPSELLTEEEVLQMINATKNPRDRAIISSLYESGCRIGEFLKIQMKDLIFEKPGCVFMVNGKTGGRRIRVISSEPYILEWINKHPDKDNPEAFVWLRNNGNEMLEYPAFCKALRVAAIRAGIKKKVNPHNFRHARATYLASKFTEQQLKVFFGWTRASDMASVYVHLSGKDVDDALLNVYGLSQTTEKNRITKLKPITCLRCNTQNEVTNKFCKLCGSILDENKRIELQAKETQTEEINKVMDILFKDKEVLALIAQKIKELRV